MGGAGRRWGEESVWLHTEADNAGANALYQAAGYSVHCERSPGMSGIFTNLFGIGSKDRLYWKPLLPVQSAHQGAEVALDDLQIEGAVRDRDKVFVWDAVTMKSKEDQ